MATLTAVEGFFWEKGKGPSITKTSIDELGKLKIAITFAKWRKLDIIFGVRVASVEVTAEVSAGAIVRASKSFDEQLLEQLVYIQVFQRSN
jgi:hypothetical protein